MKKIKVIVVLLIFQSVYAQEKYSEIDLNNGSFDEFEMLRDTLSNYRVYFTGENHMYPSFNTRFELKFLRYLHQTQGVNHFIFEQSPALGYIIEQIIIEGRAPHKLYLKDKFFDPFYELVRGIEEYNDSLPDKDKIRFHGIDLERFPYFSIYALNDLVERKNTNFTGGEVFEQIVALATSSHKDATADQLYTRQNENFNFGFGEVNGAQTLFSIIDGAREYSDSIKVKLEGDSTIFYSIIKSVEEGIEWYNAEREGDVKSPIIRERFMENEFARIYHENDQKAKYYGQFGRCHLHKDQDAGRCYDYYMNSIANRINEIDSSLNNQVLVIPIFYSKNKEFDAKILKEFAFDEKFSEDQKSFIIDLAYKNGDMSIIGFYNTLPYLIVCNADPDDFEQYNLKWENPQTDYHAGFYYGYYFFNKIRTLNYELAAAGDPQLEKRMIGYTYALDLLKIREAAMKIAYTWYRPISNGDRIKLSGSTFTIGGAYPFGNQLFSSSVGLNYGYGFMSLTEVTDGTTPNLIQSNGKNKVVYKNDYMVIDPNFEIRITMPVISLNFGAGYAFDVSGKYWRLDDKLKNFKKMSFSAPYIRFGASLHFSVRD